MAFFVVAEPAAAYRDWLAAQARPAAAPADGFLRRGQKAFFSAGCDECHAIRGTAARGRGGPDLTHVGSRLSLGAGVVRNHVGTMGGWVGGAQDLKPGIRMPSDDRLAGADLRALAAWLSSLR
jgi:cytochrome c oxidase subunit 2